MSGLRLNPAGGNPRAISTRIKADHRVATNGQRNHDMRLGRQPDYVDASRTHLNRVLVAEMTGGELRKICDQRRENADRVRQRKVSDRAAVSVAGIITFGKEAQPWVEDLPIKTQDQMFRDVAEAVAARLGTSLHGLVVHLDETAIHAHYQLAAVNFYGTPVSKTTTKHVLNQLQDIAAEVAQRFEPRIERGYRKQDRLAAGASPSQVMHRSVRRLHEDLPREISDRENERATLDAQIASFLAALATLHDKIQKNEALAAKARMKADEETERGQKAAKNTKIYEARAEKARTEAIELDAQIRALREKVTVPKVDLPDIPTPPLQISASRRKEWAQDIQLTLKDAASRINDRAHAIEALRDEILQKATDRAMAAVNSADQRAAEMEASAKMQLQNAEQKQDDIKKTRKSLEVREKSLQTREFKVCNRESQALNRETGIRDKEKEISEQRFRLESRAQAIAKKEAEIEAAWNAAHLPFGLAHIPNAVIHEAWDYEIEEAGIKKWESCVLEPDEEEWSLVGTKPADSLIGRGAISFLRAITGSLERVRLLLSKYFSPVAIEATIRMEQAGPQPHHPDQNRDASSEHAQPTFPGPTTHGP